MSADVPPPGDVDVYIYYTGLSLKGVLREDREKKERDIFLHVYIYPSGSVPTAHESLSSSSSSSSSRKHKLDCPAAAAAAAKGAWLAKEAPAEAKEAPAAGDQNWTCVWCTASNPSLYLLCGQCYREKNLRFEACTVSADMCKLRHYHTTGVPKYCKNFHE